MDSTRTPVPQGAGGDHDGLSLATKVACVFRVPMAQLLGVLGIGAKRAAAAREGLAGSNH